jgi:sugar phosphate isomerase/epimerase
LISAGCKYIELSGGQYRAGMIADLKGLKEFGHLKIHNYFPPPEDPIVINLASPDDDIARASIEHVKKAINWSAELETGVYSFHAGFLIDPRVDELGRRVRPRKLFDRYESMLRFLDRVNCIDEYAIKNGIKILLENNVLSENNYKNFECNPFLMADMDECISVMNNTSDNVKLLIDVAHLKVSSESLSFDPVEFLFGCHEWIDAYHLSDNDGKRDSNNVILEDSWFWRHLRRDLDYYSIEVYGLRPADLKAQCALVERKLVGK